jgi:hypothetical protein
MRSFIVCTLYVILLAREVKLDTEVGMKDAKCVQCYRVQGQRPLEDLSARETNSGAFSPQANYTD